MLMPNEMVTGVAQQQGARHHEFATRRRSILKRTAHHDRDTGLQKLFFERLIVGACAADDIERRPSISRCERTPPEWTGVLVRVDSRLVRFRSDRNFRQDFHSRNG
jgi:hypothetical protein